MAKRYIAEARLPEPKRGNPNPLFTKGNKLGGRRKGSLNRLPGLLKDDLSESLSKLGMLKPVWEIREGAVITMKGGRTRKLPDVKVKIIGWEPSGEEGGSAVGYLMWLGCNHPPAYAGLLGRMLPLQINATATITETVTSKFSGVDFSKMTLAEKQAAFREMIGMTKALPPQLAPPKDVTPKKLDPEIVEGEATRREE